MKGPNGVGEPRPRISDRKSADARLSCAATIVWLSCTAMESSLVRTLRYPSIRARPPPKTGAGLAPRHAFKEPGKSAHVVDHVIGPGPPAFEIRWMELAALHQYSDGSHILGSDHVGLDVISDHDRFGRCAAHVVQC